MGTTDRPDAATSWAEDGSLGVYTLRDLITDVPLSTDEDGVTAHITCVEAWNGNVYIGTSNGEVLHYVSIPPDPSDEAGAPTYIFATRIEPPYGHRQPPPDAGIKQILLLPQAGKALIACHDTMTFYTLPELSPAFDGSIKLTGCVWFGGLDRDLQTGENDRAGVVVVLCLRQKLRLIRVGDSVPRSLKNIELGGICSIERRGDIACVADHQSYSLLDVANQRKNDLSPISSLSESNPTPEPAAPPPPSARQASRSISHGSPAGQARGHERNISLGGQPRNNDRLRPDSGAGWPARGSSRQGTPPDRTPSREESPEKVDEPAKTAPGTESQTVASPPLPQLRPNIVSPTSKEFLITRGTRMSDPGVGLFVNLDGDVTRGTIEFSSYPESLVLDPIGQNALLAGVDAPSQEGYVLGIVQKKTQDSMHRCIEAQRWDVDGSDVSRAKEWLPISTLTEEETDEPLGNRMGLRVVMSPGDFAMSQASSILRLRRLCFKERPEQPNDAEERRNREEDRLVARFAQTQARILLYNKDRVSWVVRKPVIAQLDHDLSQGVRTMDNGETSIDVAVVQRVFNQVRGQEPKDELDFLTLTFTRQKASLLLFGSLVLQTMRGFVSYEHDKRRTEDALVSGDLDPRVILTLVPPLNEEIVEDGQGVWIAQGLVDTITTLRETIDFDKIVRDPRGPYGDSMLNVMKRYLFVWRKKKGFGSVADEAHVFQSVDAALIHVLLLLDQNSARGPATPKSVRAELNEVVDHGVDCFDRAVELFEKFHRLHLLSRLYQHRRMSSQVLATWKRILEGEHDAGGEFIEGEQDVRRYLAKIRDPSLVQEYGSWLAQRNPKLGVQVFADEHSRIRFEPPEAVAVLKEKAPGAVKDYLEHLVFGKNHVQYVNDLIAFYLDTVLDELQRSEEAKTILLRSYEAYRALRPPKPTYREFITDNAIAAGWWHNRLRLLQLIGGSHGAASEYSVHALRERLAPYSDELVPEMIILNGREGQHEEALRLLTHGLGDYDTAVRYCLLGGSSIFHPGAGLAPEQALPSREEQSRLFADLLHEFFRIEDLGERLARTAELLERFGGWFDVVEVLRLIPDSWSVELVSGFLVHAFRRLVHEHNETVVVKALCSAQNLRQGVELIEKSEGVRPTVVDAALDVG